MRALVYVDPGKLEWREAPDPRVGGAGEAVVRPVAAAPCDLDKAIIAGRTPLPGPFALGHECVAEVVAAGDGVKRVAVGQLVVVPWHICCGACDRCLSGLRASCFLDAPLPLLDMYSKDVTFRTGRCSVGPHIPEVLSLVASGAVHPERISHEAPWDDAIEVLLGRKLKPVLVRPQLHAVAPVG